MLCYKNNPNVIIKASEALDKLACSEKVALKYNEEGLP